MGRMSVLTKKLHVMKTGGTDEAISLYTTTSECAEPNLKLQVDGTTAYAKLGSVSDSNASSLRVYRNSDKATYAVLKVAETIVGKFTFVAEKLGSDAWGNNELSVPVVYNGKTYTITALNYGENNGTPANILWFDYESENAPSFASMTLDINGTKVEAIHNKYFDMIYNFKPAYAFVAGKSYTVKILSITS